ncbi:MAG: glucoamylase family protein [Salinivirgaceae bacterium]
MKTIQLSIVLLSIQLLFWACVNPQQSNKKQDNSISDDSLLTLIQYNTFQYFWDGAEPVSGLARERIHMDNDYPQNDQTVLTSGGSGFGLMAILVGIERGFITRQQGLERFEKIVDYLEQADRFHGAWSHWLYGETGKVKPFGKKDNGGDLVETAFLVQGLLAVRQYYAGGSEQERLLTEKINKLWLSVEWDWYRKGGENVLYWHWSPEYEWEMNFPLEGYNECLITYVLAAASPTHGIPAEVYHQGWARKGNIQGKTSQYGLDLNLKHNGAPDYGGPLFWSHYSFLGLNPRDLSDAYTNYWEHNKNHVLINYHYCVENPKQYKGYSENSWGLTASYSINGYAAHQPSEDLGVISPTAALASFPYTPEQSMKAARYFYDSLEGKLWGSYGFYDAFSEQYQWFPQRYLAIDQGPIVVMIENYRSGLIWDLFMSAPEIQEGLKKLGFESQSQQL